jgi:hypothetical protein
LYYDDDDDNAHNDGNGGGAGGGETNYVPDELVPFLGAVETTVQWLRENRSAFPPPLERVTFCSEFSLDFVVAPGEDRPKLVYTFFIIIQGMCRKYSFSI